MAQSIYNQIYNIDISKIEKLELKKWNYVEI